MPFFAWAGWPIDVPPGPSLPADTTIIRPSLSHVDSSTSRSLEVYAPEKLEPLYALQREKGLDLVDLLVKQNVVDEGE